MRIVFYSSLFFTDCDFSLVREIQKRGIGLTYYIQIVKGRQCGGLMDLRSYNLSPGIYDVRNFPEFNIYADFIDLSRVRLVVRTNNLKDLRNWKTYGMLVLDIYRLHPDCVHISQALGASEFLLYCFRRKMVMTVHDPFMHSGELNKLSERKRRLAFKLIPKLVLLNKNQCEQFSAIYHIAHNRIYVNRLGVYDCLTYLSRRSPCVNEFPTGGYILFFGHISPYKGVEILCEAMTKVHHVYPGARCVIAGKGDLYFDYSPYERCGYITLINRFIDTSELVGLIENSLFTVCPYKDATQSGVVASSFAFFKPVVATNVGGLGESVIDEVTGLLVSPNEADALAAAIMRMLSDPSLVHQLSENIKHQFGQGEVSWPFIADKYIKIYEEKTRLD